MNTSRRNRWGRYKVIDGKKHKLCNGPLHKDEGEYLTLDRYFILKKGKRAGKPISRCKACTRIEKFGTTERGLVEISRVWWIFLELTNRLGKAEVCRRLGISYNFYYRVNKCIYIRMYKVTAIRAIYLLREVRANNEVRHRDSIRHGSHMRGRVEKVPTERRDYYRPTGDHELQTRTKHRHLTKDAKPARVAS
jgi:hypothetical protein